MTYASEDMGHESGRRRVRRYGWPEPGRLYVVAEDLDAVLWEAEPATLRFTSVSPQAERLLGYPVRQWLNEPDFWIRHLHPSDRTRAREVCRSVVADGGDRTFEYRAFDAGGDVVWIRDTIHVVEDDAGRPSRLYGVMTDVTAHHTAEDLARSLEREGRARASAERANRHKTRFLAGVTHDLRTPLTAVSGYASLIAEGVYGPVDEALLEAVFRIKRSSDYLLSLIESLLDFARLDGGGVTYALEPLALEAALGDAAALVEPQMRAKGLSYGVVPGPPGVRVMADSDRLTEVLLNVMTNAAKFTSEGGITVGWDTEGSVVRIRVSDSGPGIPPDRIPTLFEPFVKGPEEGAEDGRGFGLGLAISLELARGMSGDLTVESDVGRGSTFTLALPRA